MKKLLMVDSITFNGLTTPKDKVVTSIEGEMANMLNVDRIPEDVKAKLLASAQSRYLKLEHPQWRKTTTTKTVNSPNAVLDTPPQYLARRGMPISRILKSSNRVLIDDKIDLSVDVSVDLSEDVPGGRKTWVRNWNGVNSSGYSELCFR